MAKTIGKYSLEKNIKQAQKEIEQYKNSANEHRRKAVFVSYASTLDNAHALGENVIKGFRATSSDWEDYKRSVLNERLTSVDDCFYAGLDQEKHGYRAPNYNYIKTLDLSQKQTHDCRWDGDLNQNKELEISLDYNASITCLGVAQMEIGNVYQLKNIMYVEHPQKLSDLITNFCEYYKHFKNKKIKYYYDHTAVGEDAQRKKEESYKYIVVNVLKQNGWHVVEYKFQSTTHKLRHDRLGGIFLGQHQVGGEKVPYSFMFNLDNAYAFYIAAKKTKLIIKTYYNTQGIKTTKYEKDKSSEIQKGNIKKIEQTHLTESIDGILMAKWQELSKIVFFVG